MASNVNVVGRAGSTDKLRACKRISNWRIVERCSHRTKIETIAQSSRVNGIFPISQKYSFERGDEMLPEIL
jgi:hypothetical protein